jgi:hypothetical protein
MDKNKILVMVALGLVLSPALAFGALDTSVYTEANTRADIELKPGMVLPRKNAADGEGQPKPGMIRTGVGANLKAEVSPEQMELRLKERQKMMDTLKASDAKIEAGAAARKKEILTRLQALKAAAKTKLQAQGQARVKIALGEIFMRFSNAIDKLTQVDERISAKITALQTAGTDVTTLQAAYVSAHALLVKAKVDVTATQTLASDQTAIETSKEAFRALIKTAEDSIKAAGEAYRKILPLMPTSANVDATAETSATAQ